MESESIELASTNDGPAAVGRNEEKSNMTRKSFGQEYAEALVSKAVIAGPAIVGGLLLGPVGVAIGIATAVVIAASVSSGGDSATNESQSKETSSFQR